MATTFENCSVSFGSWQSIETAPMDGTWILLSGGEINYGWDSTSVPPMVAGQWCGDGWQFAWYDGGCLGQYPNPTLWQPLPSFLITEGGE